MTFHQTPDRFLKSTIQGNTQQISIQEEILAGKDTIKECTKL